MAYGRLRVRGYGRKVGGRRVGAARGRYGRRGAVGRIRRIVNPMPTFVETFHKAEDNVLVAAGGSTGSVFKVRISDIPQWQQYLALYKQYRINWVKVTLIPQTDGSAADVNAYSYNFAQTLSGQGMGRIAWSIQDSPNVAAPATELEVLNDNGAKIRPLRSMWSCAFKPVPDLAMTGTAAQRVFTKSRFKPFLSFETEANNNPLHGAVQTFINLPGNQLGPSGPASYQTYMCYYKVSFTLRDPK